ncbi:hypothetical protein L6164_002491 [Bauhinia variegata]|uniref:Uncharacterized protein n=1 Tax=Bauhinia variegata TaxID=167791 RepID=A0ACB9Q131_BAUVA|nr:hypothetical protein L6164_002491 [Bauhinia variegata]
MGRNTFLEILLLFLIVLDCYNASFGWEHRKLADLDPSKSKPAAQDPLSPTPVPGENSDPKTIGETKNNTTDPVPTNDTQKGDPKGVSPTFPPIAKVGNETLDPNGSKSNNSTPASPPTVTKTNDEKDHEKEEEKNGAKSGDKEKEKNEVNTIQQSNTDKSCDGLNPRCHDHNKMVGCIFETGSKLVILVQNGEESTIKVKISSMESNLGDAEVAKHRTRMINITLTNSGITKLTLNAGHGDCDLQLVDPVSEGNFFVRLPSYDKLLTPVNGAYFLIITVIVFGGTWACCKCRTKKRHDGIEYQELEMALPGSSTNVETADGWDQSWDDDWDEDTAVKSPGRRVAGISANGLTSRSSNKDGWENNWDD